MANNDNLIKSDSDSSDTTNTEEHKSLPSFESKHYPPLPRRRGIIRLLRLAPNVSKTADVECELITPSEGETKIHRYEALSWCWGAEVHTAHVTIRKDEKYYSKKVAPNLLSAFKALRYPDRPRYIWVDLICIDQDELTEKNHQVEMMHDIYDNADRVCIWLGDGDESSKTALKFIKKEVLQLQKFDILCDSQDATKKWHALLELMQRPWFSRRWVVQEIALARDAVIFCGKDTLPWNDFATAVELFVEVETVTHRLSEVMRKVPEFYHVPGWFEYVSALGASLLVDATERLFRDKEMRQNSLVKKPKKRTSKRYDRVEPLSVNDVDTKYKDVSGVSKDRLQPLLSLEHLVSGLTIFNTSNPHDTIYALLAIAKDTTPTATSTDIQSSDHAREALEHFTQKKQYPVNYQLPYVDVCRDFIQFSVERSMHVDPARSLDVICRPWATEEKYLEQRREARTKETEEVERQKKEDLEIMKNRNKYAKSVSSDPQKQGQDNDGEENEDLGRPEEIVTSETQEKDVKADPLGDLKDIPLPSWVPQLSRAPFGLYESAGIEGPRMSRKNADPLVGLSHLTHQIYAAAQTKKVDMQSLKFRKRTNLKHQNDHYSMYVRGFYLDEIDVVEEVALNGHIPKDWATLGGWVDAEGKPPEAFWRTLVANRGKDGRNSRIYYARACEESFRKGAFESGAVNTTDLIRYERNSVVAEFCRRVQAVVWNRALVRTKNGRLGLVNKGVKTGDRVCILYGCSVPLVLRESKKKEPEAFDEEIDWELRFIARTVMKYYKQHLVRRKHHKKRKLVDVVRLLREWKQTERWEQSWVLARDILKDKEGIDLDILINPQTDTKQSLLEKMAKIVTILARTLVPRFADWRIEQSRDRELEKKKEKPVKRTRGKERYDQLVQERKAMADAQRQHHGNDGTSKERPTHLQVSPEKQKDPIDWWEFELFLRYFRKWKDAVDETRAARHARPDMESLVKYYARQKLYEKKYGPVPPPAYKLEFKAQYDYCYIETVEGPEVRISFNHPTSTDDRVFDDSLAHAKPKPIVRLPDQVQGPTGSGKDTFEQNDAVAGAQEPKKNASLKPEKGHSRFLVEDAGKLYKEISKAGPLLPPPVKREPPKNSGPLSDGEVKDFNIVVRENLIDRLGKEGYVSYELLGDCYVHGMMDGEAMVFQNEGWHDIIPSVVFEIR